MRKTVSVVLLLVSFLFGWLMTSQMGLFMETQNGFAMFFGLVLLALTAFFLALAGMVWPMKGDKG